MLSSWCWLLLLNSIIKYQSNSDRKKTIFDQNKLSLLIFIQYGVHSDLLVAESKYLVESDRIPILSYEALDFKIITQPGWTLRSKKNHEPIKSLSRIDMCETGCITLIPTVEPPF